MSTHSPALPSRPSADEVLTALDPEQREVAASPLGPMCVLAGAGTGKTRAITHRIAYGVHAAALRQLHYFWPQAIGGAAPEVMSHKAPAVAQAAASLRLQFDRTGIRDLAAEVEWAKVNMLTPETYAAA